MYICIYLLFIGLENKSETWNNILKTRIFKLYFVLKITIMIINLVFLFIIYNGIDFI